MSYDDPARDLYGNLIHPSNLFCVRCGRPIAYPGPFTHLCGFCEPTPLIFAEDYQTWTVSISGDYTGTVNSSDCEGEGIKITCKQDIINLLSLINRLLSSSSDDTKWFRRYDGAIIKGYKSNKKAGYYVIEKEDGNWFRLSRSELEGFRNELSKYV